MTKTKKTEGNLRTAQVTFKVTAQLTSKEFFSSKIFSREKSYRWLVSGSRSMEKRDDSWWKEIKREFLKYKICVSPYTLTDKSFYAIFGRCLVLHTRNRPMPSSDGRTVWDRLLPDEEHWEQAVQMKWIELNKKRCRTQHSTPRQLHMTNTKYSPKTETIVH